LGEDYSLVNILNALKKGGRLHRHKDVPVLIFGSTLPYKNPKHPLIKYCSNLPSLGLIYMASLHSNASLCKQPIATHSTTVGRPKIRLWRRGRKLPIVHLGGKKPRRGFFLSRFLRGARLRWLKLQSCCILRRLKKYYRSLIKDLIEASASAEAYQQRILMETSLAVPVMGVSFNNYHGGGSLRGPRSIFM